MRTNVLYTLLSLFLFAAFWKVSPVSAAPAAAASPLAKRFCRNMVCREAELPLPLGTANADSPESHNMTFPYATHPTSASNANLTIEAEATDTATNANGAFGKSGPSLSAGLFLVGVVIALHVFV